jgi:hypothetical protein
MDGKSSLSLLFLFQHSAVVYIRNKMLVSVVFWDDVFGVA